MYALYIHNHAHKAIMQVTTASYVMFHYLGDLGRKIIPTARMDPNSD